MIGLVSCSATKLGTPAPAGLLYCSPLFRLSLAHAVQRCATVYVLSALHGLVALDAVLEPYEHRMPSAKRERQRWAAGVSSSIVKRHPRDERVMLLAGQDYAAPLVAALRWEGWTGDIVQPLKGMQIGQRLAHLKQLDNEGIPW